MVRYSTIMNGNTLATFGALAETKGSQVAWMPEHFIGHDESIIFAIKPSLWFIVFDSAKWLISAAVVIVCAGWLSAMVPSLAEPQLISIVLAVLGSRVLIALLRWVSRFYVLTNRRVMGIRGVFRADVFECPLIDISKSSVYVSFPEALTKLGSIRFTIRDRELSEGRKCFEWRHITHPREIHAQVRQAIRRARDCQPRI